MRQTVLITLIGMVIPLLALRGEAETRPNVVLLVSDDQRPDTIHELGNEIIRTPNWDRMVAKGTTFTRAITAAPLCVPSRAELLTGRDGLFNGNQDHGLSPCPDVPHLARTMRDAGYETCYVGKWHTVGRPSDSGYAEVAGLYAGGGGRFPLTHPVDWKGQPVTGYRGWVFQTDDKQLFPEKGVGLTPEISEIFADAAIGFVQQKHEGPFFLHVNFTAPHDPLFWPTDFEDAYDSTAIQVPANFATEHPFDHGNFRGRDELLFDFPRTTKQTRKALAVYYAVLTHLDQQVGRLLEVVDVMQENSPTIVIYTSDHGLAMGSHGLRGKQNMYEHSIGVPLIFSGANIDRDRRTTAQCYLRDLYPTICDLIGTEIPETVQGKSLLPVLKGESEKVYDAVFSHFRDTQRAIRTDKWKYIIYPQAGREQLFHLNHDPDELTNLAEDEKFSNIKADLASRLDEWRRERADPTLTP